MFRRSISYLIVIKTMFNFKRWSKIDLFSFQETKIDEKSNLLTINSKDVSPFSLMLNIYRRTYRCKAKQCVFDYFRQITKLDLNISIRRKKRETSCGQRASEHVTNIDLFHWFHVENINKTRFLNEIRHQRHSTSFSQQVWNDVCFAKRHDTAVEMFSIVVWINGIVHVFLIDEEYRQDTTRHETRRIPVGDIFSFCSCSVSCLIDWLSFSFPSLSLCLSRH